MDSYNFTVFFVGVDIEDDHVLDALFEAACDDATFGSRTGMAYGEFDRPAPSFSEAVISAVRAIESIDVRARVTRVEPDDLVTQSVIAERVGRSRENVRQLSTGSRGPGDFPDPAGWVNAKTAVWHWGQVAEWFESYSGESLVLGGAPQFTAALNGILEARTQMVELSRIAERRSASLKLAFDSKTVAELNTLLAEETDVLQRELAGV
jgi:hypothetical protein